METVISYFFFIIHSMHHPTTEEFLQEVDFNNDGKFSTGELKIMETRLFDVPLKDADRASFAKTLESCAKYISSEGFTPQNIIECPDILNLFEKATQKILRYDYEHEMVDRSEMTFRMLKGNLIKVRAELDNVRRELSKFVCLNDDLDHGGTEEDEKIAHHYDEFHNSLFPDASPFELPSDSENMFLHL